MSTESNLRPNRKPLLLALSAVLGVLAAAGGHLISGASADQEPDPVHDTAFAASATVATPSTPSRPAATSTPATTSAPTTSSTTLTTEPTPTTTTSTTPSRSTSARPPRTVDDSLGGQVLALVNAERDRAGCGPVDTDDRLTAAAQGHSDDMSARGYFAHTTPEGVTFDERIREAGYPAPGAENIAMGTRSAARVMSMWMDSPGHRANILNCSLSTLGVGVNRDGWYWTQNFGY